MNNKSDYKGSNFNRLFILVFLSHLFIQVYGQKSDEFPTAWIGKWKGNMEIYMGPNKIQSLPMQLHILPTDSANIFTYRIIYGQDTVKGERPYLIRIIDAVKGQYKIDEQNSISIDASLLGNQLTSCFEVEGNLIFDILEKKGDTLYWRLISGKTSPTALTGNSKQGEEIIPLVKTFPIGILQSAELRK